MYMGEPWNYGKTHPESKKCWLVRRSLVYPNDFLFFFLGSSLILAYETMGKLMVVDELLSHPLYPSLFSFPKLAVCKNHFSKCLYLWMSKASSRFLRPFFSTSHVHWAHHRIRTLLGTIQPSPRFNTTCPSSCAHQLPLSSSISALRCCGGFTYS